MEQENTYYISKPIKNQFEKTKKIIYEEKQDRVFLITGREGSGKSLLAKQFAYFFDNTFDLNDIAFNSDQFESLIKNTQKQVLVFDEAFNGLSSRGSVSKENKRLVRLLIECRQRNLIVFIVLPSIFLLEKYISIFRSHALFHVAISQKNYKNRFYKVYNYSKKKELYVFGQKYMSYSKPKIVKMHRFYGKPIPTIDEEAYELKKLEAFRESGEEEKEDSRIRKQRDYLMYYLKHKFKMRYVDQAKLLTDVNLGIKVSTISGGIKEIPQKFRISEDNLYYN